MFPIRDHNPSEKIPFVTYGLIALNVAIHIWVVLTVTSDAALYELYYCCAMIPARISAGDSFLSLFTSVFLHGGWLHLLGNMLFLFIFGDNIEDILGHVGFLLFYLACGIAATLSQYMLDPASPVPMVGASGAIAGVMGAYLLLFPKARVDILVFFIVFFRIFPIPAWIMLGLWFGMQILGSFASVGSEGGVAYWAHAGGFIAGLIVIVPIWMRRGGAEFWSRTHGHPPHPEATYRFAKSSIPRAGHRR